MPAPTLSCQNCQTHLPEDALFCPECGSRVADNNQPSSTSRATDASAVTMETIGGMATLGGLHTVIPGLAGGQSVTVAEMTPGTLFANRYVIEERIGAGGMGVVYRAHDQMAQLDLAIKVIHPHRVSPQETERLKQEGLLARNLRHKNIVAVYDINECNGQHFIVMELLKGVSLRDYHRQFQMDRKSVPFMTASTIVWQILDGLKVAHEQGVIHRDLKPENIMIVQEPNGDQNVRILDFGIARLAADGYEKEKPLGTRGYMAPEQLTNPDLVRPSADLYSVSMIYYELLCDALPVGPWQPPSSGRTDVPQSIDRLIESGLSNRPANRPQSAEQYVRQMGNVNPRLIDGLIDAEVVPKNPLGNFDLTKWSNHSWNLNQLDFSKPETKQKLKWAGVGLGVFFLIIVVIGALMEEAGLGDSAPDYDTNPSQPFVQEYQQYPNQPFSTY